MQLFVLACFCSYLCCRRKETKRPKFFERTKAKVRGSYNIAVKLLIIKPTFYKYIKKTLLRDGKKDNNYWRIHFIGTNLCKQAYFKTAKF